MDTVDNKQFIRDFHLPKGSSEDQTYTRVLLQLFGYAGNGKSAFVNSCIYTLGEDEFWTRATTGSTYEIITTRRNSYKLTDTITIVDNRGFGQKKENEEMVAYAQLGNFLPLDKEVVLSNDFDQIMSQLEDSDLTPNYTDFIVPVFVYSANYTFSDHDVKDVKRFFLSCKKMTGVVPLVVLTHKLSVSCKDLERKFKTIGAEVMLSIENYTSKDHIKTRGRCNDIQNVIVNALKDVTFRLGVPRNPMKERIERRKFLLKFAHEFTVKELILKTEKEATKKEYERLEALANASWTYKFPYGKKREF